MTRGGVDADTGYGEEGRPGCGRRARRSGTGGWRRRGFDLLWGRHGHGRGFDSWLVLVASVQVLVRQEWTKCFLIKTHSDLLGFCTALLQCARFSAANLTLAKIS